MIKITKCIKNVMKMKKREKGRSIVQFRFVFKSINRRLFYAVFFNVESYDEIFLMSVFVLNLL